MKRIWEDDQGVLTFEWILLITLIVIGILGGFSTVRDGLVDELADIGDAVMHIDQSWSVEVSACDPLSLDCGSYDDPYAGTAPSTPIVTRDRGTPPVSQ